MNTCSCHAKKPFDKCCGRFLNAGLIPKTPEQLMRSRYSAYAIGGYGEYLLATWLPVMAPKLSAIQLSKKEYEWVKLEIIAKGQKGDDAWVEFKAYHRLHDTEEMDCLHERSVFKRIQGKWLYVGGEVE